MVKVRAIYRDASRPKICCQDYRYQLNTGGGEIVQISKNLHSCDAGGRKEKADEEKESLSVGNPDY